MEYEKEDRINRNAAKKIPYSCFQCRRETDGHDSGLCEACRKLNAHQHEELK